MAQIFRPRATTAIRLALVAMPLLFLAVIGFGYWYQSSGYVTAVNWAVDQRVPFSHKHHVGGLGLDCRYCHTGVEDAAFAGMPPTATCMTCHSQIWTNAGMLAPVRNSLATGTPIAWNRVYALPDYVYFDHHVHVRNGIGCTSCHGDMATQPLTARQTPLTMGWCLDCHRDPGRHLRPEGRIFDPHAPDPDNGPARAAELLRHYAIETANLTDCSTCHR